MRGEVDVNGGSRCNQSGRKQLKSHVSAAQRRLGFLFSHSNCLMLLNITGNNAASSTWAVLPHAGDHHIHMKRCINLIYRQAAAAISPTSPDYFRLERRQRLVVKLHVSAGTSIQACVRLDGFCLGFKVLLCPTCYCWQHKQVLKRREKEILLKFPIRHFRLWRKRMVSEMMIVQQCFISCTSLKRGLNDVQGLCGPKQQQQALLRSRKRTEVNDSLGFLPCCNETAGRWRMNLKRREIINWEEKQE